MIASLKQINRGNEITPIPYASDVVIWRDIFLMNWSNAHFSLFHSILTFIFFNSSFIRVRGEVMSWDFKVPKKAQVTILQSGMPHTRPVFSIHSTSPVAGSVLAVTTSLDRQINVWNITTLSSVSVIPTVGGFVYSMDVSPLDHSRLAIGCGDQQLRVWNLDSLNDSYKISNFWQGIQAKVTCVCILLSHLFLIKLVI